MSDMNCEPFKNVKIENNTDYYVEFRIVYESCDTDHCAAEAKEKARAGGNRGICLVKKISAHVYEHGKDGASTPAKHYTASPATAFSCFMINKLNDGSYKVMRIA